jgi:tetratricopeptide (TPR) repeat protein
MQANHAIIVGICCSVLGCYAESEPNLIQPPTPTPAERAAAAARRAAEPQDSGLPEWVVWYREGFRLMVEEEFEPSIRAFDKTLELAPKFSHAYVNRGIAYRGLGDFRNAIADLRRGIELDRSSGFMHRLYLAETLATCPDAELRNGSEAIKIATKGCDSTGWKHGLMLAVLAAAYAESGEFDEAVRWQVEARRFAEEPFAEEMESRLDQYRRREPCRRFLIDTARSQPKTGGSGRYRSRPVRTGDGDQRRYRSRQLLASTRQAMPQTT